MNIHMLFLEQQGINVVRTLNVNNRLEHGGTQNEFVHVGYNILESKNSEDFNKIQCNSIHFSRVGECRIIVLVDIQS